MFTKCLLTFSPALPPCLALPCFTPQVHNEAEIKKLLPIAKKHGVPVTFRAAGTSLSGQAITDSVLLKLSHTGKHFRNYTIHVSEPTTYPTGGGGLCALLYKEGWGTLGCCAGFY